jgi:integrase
MRKSRLLIFAIDLQYPLDFACRQGEKWHVSSGLKLSPQNAECRERHKRHTTATLAIAAGVSVKVISDQLGHASISFTLECYSHTLPSIQDEAAARVEQLLMG